MTRTQTAALSLVLSLPILLATSPALADDAQSLVSESSAKTSVVSAAPATSSSAEPEDDIRLLFELYREAQSGHMSDEADTLAKRIVEVSIRDNGPNSRTTAVALTNLANFQSSTEDNVAALQNYSRAIDIVERIDSRLSSDLITPLRGMGYAHQRAGNPDQARGAWSRALHVSHVNFGPHNFEQIEMLRAIGRLFRIAGMHKEAAKVQKRIDYLRNRVTSPARIGE